VILYDEPTTGVDPIMADSINRLIVELHDHLRVTGVAVTHDMISAYRIADRIAMLHEGRIVQIGAPEEIRGTSNPVVKNFILGISGGGE
jgi:phospholipid/cholesterol/gamma-HCH transport system ATP-binding protein